MDSFYDYEQTVLRFKKDFTGYEDMLSEDLSDDYSVIVGDPLTSSSTADIEVIIGKK